MKIKIGNMKVGDNEPCFVIAEAGINHNGDIKIAKKLVDSAKACGANAIKFQTFKTEKFLSKNIVIPKHIKSPKSLFNMIKKWELSKKDHYELAQYCKNKKIIFMSTPLDFSSVDLLFDLRVPVFKVASCDLDNLPLLKYIASMKKPIILSTGMGSLTEVGDAIEAIRSKGNNKIVLLHCVSIYPPKVKDVNLKAIETIKCSFKLPVGYSDHTIGINIPLAAVAMGANVIEKHFTLDKNMEGPDHAVSADPGELKSMVNGIREIEYAFGTGEKKPSKSELEMRKAFRRSIVANKDIKKGETITEKKLSLKRPGTGISPKYLDFILGKKAKRNIKYDQLLNFKDF